jgi:hypothetical protein
VHPCYLLLQRCCLTLPQALVLALALGYVSIALSAPHELRIYSDDMPNKDEAELELLMSVAKPKATEGNLQGSVIQTLVEYSYGLGQGWSVGLQLPMSQSQGRYELNGLKAEVQFVAEHDAQRGFYWGVRGDLGYSSSPYETNGSNGIEVNPILGYRMRDWHFVFNPSVEIPLSGSTKQAQFHPSAKVATSFTSTQQLGFEYFSRWGALSSPLPQRQRDDMLYLVWDSKRASTRWNFGVGRPLAPAAGNVDHWVAKVGVGLDLD